VEPFASSAQLEIGRSKTQIELRTIIAPGQKVITVKVIDYNVMGFVHCNAVSPLSFITKTADIPLIPHPTSRLSICGVGLD
jgi:hypothetical protein